MRIIAIAKDYYLIAKIRLGYKESIDNKDLDSFARMGLRGFLKPRIVRKNLLEYKGPVGISLHDRFSKPISKYDFFLIVEQFITATRLLKENGFSLENAFLDIKRVYINQITKEIQLIYLPTIPKLKSNTPLEFLESLVYSIIPEYGNDTKYISEFCSFIKNMNSYDPDLIEKYILLEEKAVVNVVKKHNMGQSGFITNKQKDYYEHYQQNDSNESDQDFDEKTGLLVEDDLNDMDNATQLLNDEDDDYETCETTMLDDDGSSETTLLVDHINVSFPKLLRVSTGETVQVDKPVYRIGKERSHVDFFISDNSAVSRSHADIITRNNRFFVVDLNSKNRTYINNVPLQIKVETEIHDGDKLRLANEDFEFYI